MIISGDNWYLIEQNCLVYRSIEVKKEKEELDKKLISIEEYVLEQSVKTAASKSKLADKTGTAAHVRRRLAESTLKANAFIGSEEITEELVHGFLTGDGIRALS